MQYLLHCSSPQRPVEQGQDSRATLGMLTGNPLGTTCQHTSCLVKRQKFKLVQPK